MPHRLLAVDDDSGIRCVYQAHFSRVGFEVRAAGSLPEAAECLASTVFDAVITDVELTPEGGSEGLVIAAFVQHLRHTPLAWPAPIIVVTSYGMPARALAAARFGADIFLHKPVSLLWLERELRGRIGARRRPRLLQPRGRLVPAA